MKKKKLLQVGLTAVILGQVIVSPAVVLGDDTASTSEAPTTEAETSEPTASDTSTEAETSEESETPSSSEEAPDSSTAPATSDSKPEESNGEENGEKEDDKEDEEDEAAEGLFLRNLIEAVSWGEEILAETDVVTNEFTIASVAANREALTAAVVAGSDLLDAIPTVDETDALDLDAAKTQEEEIVAATRAINSIIENNLAATLPIDLILAEVEHLTGAYLDPSKPDVREELYAAITAVEEARVAALTNAEVATVVGNLQKILDELHLLVQVRAFDEKGEEILIDVKSPVADLTGLFKTGYVVTPPVIPGYEFVDANRLTGNFGDGVNDIALAYKKVEAAPGKTAPDPIPSSSSSESSSTSEQPKDLPRLAQTNVSLGSGTTLAGLGAAAASLAAFIKARRNKK
ncbi:MucBP domain-containing protein [Vagococcus salmoninarum]|uniref:Gram-positive cocci surface proteins LPxTG domain-containing protein n=1 Tax=Vagococcus salmoninarum TaxID=2739 RepID=A0A429ZTL8_9ENTE|nr:MucBP domain-containing protein [Vagococcus salmoninarum]RST96989.1 hypothetical protein CBF35_03430 [Vagococcus salmoninarum]